MSCIFVKFTSRSFATERSLFIIRTVIQNAIVERTGRGNEREEEILKGKRNATTEDYLTIISRTHARIE